MFQIFRNFSLRAIKSVQIDTTSPTSNYSTAQRPGSSSSRALELACPLGLRLELRPQTLRPPILYLAPILQEAASELLLRVLAQEGMGALVQARALVRNRTLRPRTHLVAPLQRHSGNLSQPVHSEPNLPSDNPPLARALLLRDLGSHQRQLSAKVHLESQQCLVPALGSPHSARLEPRKAPRITLSLLLRRLGASVNRAQPSVSQHSWALALGRPNNRRQGLDSRRNQSLHLDSLSSHLPASDNLHSLDLLLVSRPKQRLLLGKQHQALALANPGSHSRVGLASSLNHLGLESPRSVSQRNRPRRSGNNSKGHLDLVLHLGKAQLQMEQRTLPLASRQRLPLQSRI